jgi:hypothetical protein
VGTPLIVELIPDPELGGFTARIPDIPAYGEEKTEDEAIVDLKEALRACIEAFGIDDALARANVALTVRPLDWPLQDLTPPRGQTTSPKWPTNGSLLGIARLYGGSGAREPSCHSTRDQAYVNSSSWQPCAQNRNSAGYSPRLRTPVG